MTESEPHHELAAGTEAVAALERGDGGAEKPAPLVLLGFCAKVARCCGD